jgi:hypothetical protein
MDRLDSHRLRPDRGVVLGAHRQQPGGPISFAQHPHRHRQRQPGRPLVGAADAETAARLPAELRDMLREAAEEGGKGEGEEKEEEKRGEAVAYYVVEDGHVRLGLNAEFERRLMGTRQACDFVGKHAMLPIYLWGW